MQARLSFPVSCMPGFDFCKTGCVEGVPHSESLKAEIVDGYGELVAVMRKLADDFNHCRKYAVDACDLRREFHAAGVNMCMLGTVYDMVDLPYVKVVGAGV